MDTATTGGLFASPPHANLPSVARVILRPDRIGPRSTGRNVLIARYAKLQSRYLPLMDTHVHHTDGGAANSEGTLLLIRDFDASLHTWDDVLPQFTRRYRVIRLDLSPFGITGPLRDTRDRPCTVKLPLYRDFINTFVDTLGLSRLTLVSNSLGDMISWDFAVRRPGRVKKLMLISSAGFPIKLPIYIDLFNHIGVRMASPRVLPEGIVRAAARDVYGDPSHMSEPTLHRYTDLFYADGARQTIDKMVPKFRFDDVGTSGLASVRVPTLILRGQHDRWVLSVHIGGFARRIPGTMLRMYSALGHIPIKENPVHVGTDLCTFLNQGRASTRLSETAFQEDRP